MLLPRSRRGEPSQLFRRKRRRGGDGGSMRASMTPRSTVVLFAHPYPDRSRAGRLLLDAVRDLPRLSVRSLYALYPDFAIDVEAEQAALAEADVVVWQAPLFWYSVPALLHLWIEKVLAHGWAYGGGTA